VISAPREQSGDPLAHAGDLPIQGHGGTKLQAAVFLDNPDEI
jgi:hypothetical protein